MENKKRASTTVLIICLVFVCILCVFDYVIATGINPQGSAPAGGTEEGSYMTGAIVSVVVAFGLMIVIGLSSFIIIISAFCLKFSIRNTKNESKPIRIMNIILSCCFSAGVALGIIATIIYGVKLI